jgi:hypothetical protein
MCRRAEPWCGVVWSRCGGRGRSGRCATTTGAPARPSPPSTPTAPTSRSSFSRQAPHDWRSGCSSTGVVRGEESSCNTLRVPAWLRQEVGCYVNVKRLTPSCVCVCVGPIYQEGFHDLRRATEERYLDFRRSYYQAKEDQRRKAVRKRRSGISVRDTRLFLQSGLSLACLAPNRLD